MPAADPRVDAYIARARPFAQPILRRVRAVVHAACPEVEETIKWRMPFFVHHGILCCVAAFKAHCALVFWKRAQFVGEDMGRYRKLAAVEDLPARATLVRLVKQAVSLNETGTPSPISLRRKRSASSAAPRPPADLVAALAASPRARATYDGFSAGSRREYVEWIAEAKRPETRAKRIATAIGWMQQGRRRNWKYER